MVCSDYTDHRSPLHAFGQIAMTDIFSAVCALPTRTVHYGTRQTKVRCYEFTGCVWVLCPLLLCIQQDFAKAGADMYTFHLEAAQPDVSRLTATQPDEAVASVSAGHTHTTQR